MERLKRLSVIIVVLMLLVSAALADTLPPRPYDVFLVRGSNDPIYSNIPEGTVTEKEIDLNGDGVEEKLTVSVRFHALDYREFEIPAPVLSIESADGTACTVDLFDYDITMDHSADGNPGEVFGLTEIFFYNGLIVVGEQVRVHMLGDGQDLGIALIRYDGQSLEVIDHTYTCSNECEVGEEYVNAVAAAGIMSAEEAEAEYEKLYYCRSRLSDHAQEPIMLFAAESIAVCNNSMYWLWEDELDPRFLTVSGMFVLNDEDLADYGLPDELEDTYRLIRIRDNMEVVDSEGNPVDGIPAGIWLEWTGEKRFDERGDEWYAAVWQDEEIWIEEYSAGVRCFGY